jgi:hypothetical protein
MLKMPPAKSPSPVAGKFPGEGVKVWGSGLAVIRGREMEVMVSSVLKCIV